MEKARWFCIIGGAFGIGLWLGIVLTEVRLAQEPQIVYREVLPSPQVYEDGKRSEPGVLSLETLRAIELQSTKDVFSVEPRDPFERVR